VKIAAEGEVLDIPVGIASADVLHFLGYPEGHRPPPQIEIMLEAALDEARARAAGRGAFRVVDPAEAPRVGLETMDASALVLGLVTVGGAIEARASELLGAGETTRALLVDAAGSAAAEEAADRLGALIAGEEAALVEPPEVARGVTSVSCRVSPGYGAWPLTAQRQLFPRLSARELGVELQPSLLMVPRKSISFAMWLGAEARPVAGLSGCARCHLEHCRYRRREA